MIRFSGIPAQSASAQLYKPLPNPSARADSQPMSRLSALLVVLAVWAAIYLPALGSLEIKGEEGRRILPAVTMLETGNFVVPQVGSEPYLRKPPLVNWLVAGSFKLFGQQNEWTARLPSVLAVLVVALAFVALARRSLSANGSLFAAIIWLANFGIIEKGRLIEIEALYVSLSALAIICWLSWWSEQRSRWLTWTVPWVFLGFAFLAKGPTHLIFFYAIVIAVLFRAGDLRSLWNPAHAIGILIMFGMFAAWAIPYLQMMQASHVTHVWSRQFSGRLSGEDFKLVDWLLNIPRGLGYFLPWTILLLALPRVTFASDRDKRLARGLVLGIGVSFVGVSLLPGALPRYTMPLLGAACWLVAMILCAPEIRWPRWMGTRFVRRENRASAVLVVAVVACTAICVYAIAIVPWLQKRAKVKTIAAQIDGALPPLAQLYAVNPEYQPFLFYVRHPVKYVSTVDEIPPGARFFLVQPKDELAAQTREMMPDGPARAILRIKDYRKRKTTLYAVMPEVIP